MTQTFSSLIPSEYRDAGRKATAFIQMLISIDQIAIDPSSLSFLLALGAAQNDAQAAYAFQQATRDIPKDKILHLERVLDYFHEPSKEPKNFGACSTCSTIKHKKCELGEDPENPYPCRNCLKSGDSATCTGPRKSKGKARLNSKQNNPSCYNVPGGTNVNPQPSASNTHIYGSTNEGLFSSWPPSQWASLSGSEFFGLNEMM